MGVVKCFIIEAVEQIQRAAVRWSSFEVVLLPKCKTRVLLPHYLENCKKNCLKSKTVKGEAYTLKDGTTAPARATKASCSCCRGCFMKFNDTEKVCLIDSFNHTGSKNLQDSYLLILLTGTGLEGNFPILIRK